MLGIPTRTPSIHAMATPAFHWDDPLLLDEQLSADERAVRDAARDYCQGRLLPRVTEAFRHERTDPEIFREMGALGLLGATVPEAYGGAGLNYVCYGLVAREVERVDSGYRSMMSVQSSLVMLPILAFGTEAQKQNYLPRLARGEAIGCFGLTEPNHGSDPGGMATRARKVDGGYLLSGSKMWITNSPIADVFVVWAKDDAQQIRGFVLEKGAKGLSAPAIHGKVGLRASITGEIVMDEVFVPEAQALPRGARPQGPLHLPEQRPLRHCLGRAGRGRGLLPPRPPVQRSTASSSAARSPPTNWCRRSWPTCSPRSRSAFRACCGLGRMKDEGIAATDITSIMKRNSCGKALDIARTARDMLGGNGISDEFGVARHLVNLEVVNTYEGTHDVHALILGRAITGIAAFGG